MEEHMNIERNNMFKKDFTYPLFSRVRKISDTTFSFVLKRSTFLFNEKEMTYCHLNCCEKFLKMSLIKKQIYLYINLKKY